MAKKSSVEKNEHRRDLVQRFKARRSELKKLIMSKEVDPEERFEATLKLATLPRNGSKVRIRNRCALTGRPRAYYRKFGLSRIALRELASNGQIPGCVKSSW
ncbi:SSU ribosomal protein S14P [Arboricoccus pini]|uniref:Small ribosomal subunit protein uS14 n=1 Tax=Arboricoccus pini TaxID=1963835 RepID=A0A212QTT3_9PROT|nr:30S ribosomal protein S14 [Arboricoccus pini]SNB63039.1 SSU ribosomal protein S14P [Arboricoccus pini]